METASLRFGHRLERAGQGITVPTTRTSWVTQAVTFLELQRAEVAGPLVSLTGRERQWGEAVGRGGPGAPGWAGLPPRGGPQQWTGHAGVSDPLPEDGCSGLG